MDSHFALIDPSTLDVMHSSFLAKNAWRVKRIEQYRIDKHNEAKIKAAPKRSSPVPFDHSMPLVQTTAASTSRGDLEKLSFDQLNDIPTMIDAGIDPILAMSTCRNQKDLRRVHNAIKEVTRPKSARNKANTQSNTPSAPALSPAGKTIKRTPSSPAAFMQMAARQASASNLQLPDVAPARRPNTAAAQPRSSKRNSTEMFVTFDVPPVSSKPTTPSCLMGSSRIP